MLNSIFKFLTKILISLPQSVATTLTKDSLLSMFKRKKKKTLKPTNGTSVSETVSEETEYTSELKLRIPGVSFDRSIKRKAINNHSQGSKAC